MSGVMAGSAILAARAHRDTLGTVTLTINNVCNLSCPHCYLQYDGPADLIDEAIVGHLFDSVFDRVCIVGKEPLADPRSIDVVRRIVERAAADGREVSLITNGLNGSLVPRAVVERLTWVDVSLDGGRDTYRVYRRGSWEKLHRSIACMRGQGLKDLRILQTLSTATIRSLADMVETSFALGASCVVFSPYQPSRNHGTQTVLPLSPTVLVGALAPYASDTRIYLSFDAGYAAHFEDAPAAVTRATNVFGERFSYVDSDPLDRGIIRVTYDGLVLTPFEAVNTDDYRVLGRSVMGRPLDAWFTEMLHLSRASSLN